jgi:hypothetical protein
MHRSFGIETRPTSTEWKDILKGPAIRDVRDHLRKIHNYSKLTKSL